MNTKFVTFVRLTCVTMVLVAVLSIVPFTQAQAAHASAAISDPMVLVAVDVTSPSCQIHTTRTRGATSITSSTLCLPGTAMKTEQVPLSQARAHHWSYLALSSATPQQIAALMQTQRLSLRAHLASVSGTQERKALSPNYSCGWNTSTSVNNVLDADTVSAEVYYYLASDCSHIILNYGTTELFSPYYNPMYWTSDVYNYGGQGSDNYCFFHTCWWGYFNQTVAPTYTVYRRTFNTNEDAGRNFTQWYSNTYDPNAPGSASFSIDLGNLS